MQLLFEKEKPLSPQELKQIYASIFNTKDGKIILEDLANMSGMYRSNFIYNNSSNNNDGVSNSHYTAFLEGHRALFLYIGSQLNNKIENIEGKTIC